VNSDTFLPPFSFKMKRRILSKTVSFHALFKKKTRDQNGVVLNGTITFLLSLDARSREEEDFFFLCFPPPALSLKKTSTNSTCPKLSTCWRRGRRCVPRAVFGAATQWPPPASLSPVFPINAGESTKKRGGKREETEKERLEKRRERRKGGRPKEKKEKKNRAEKREKERKRKKRQKRKKTEEGERGRRRRSIVCHCAPDTAGSCVLPPPPPPAAP